MKFYFNCNNRTQARALKEAGVKNVMLSYQYCREAFDIYSSMFDGIGVIPGKAKNVDDYYEWAKLNIKRADFITQYDVPMDMEQTIKYYFKGESLGISPVLTVNYLQHLGRINLHDDRTVVLGKMGGNIEEDGQVPKLPPHNYHGLSKGRWLGKASTSIKSFNSSTWLSGVRGRKTDVWKGESVTFGNKGKGNTSSLYRALEMYRENLNEMGVDDSKIHNGEYDALLKAPLAFYYKPMFAALGSSSENFQTV